MTKVKVFGILISALLFACNTADDKNDQPTAEENVSLQYQAYIKELTAQVKLNPDSAGLRLKLAAALDSIGNYKEALQQMDSLLAKDSANFGLWFTQGKIAEDAGDTLLALMGYDKAIRIYPSADALLSIANLYAEKRDKAALIFCKQVKDQRLGRDYDAHCAFIEGVYYARTGDQKMALQSFDECIANNYTYMEAYIEKGLLYFDHQQYNEALNVFRFASSVNALDADPYYWQGRCYEMMNIKDSAVLRFKQSLSLDKNDKQTKEALKRLGE
ncbi:MAG: tetratricopeptide repeat protein [Panacibacter sp.]